MVTVRNTHQRTPIGLPNRTVIEPGKTGTVSDSDWEAMQKNLVVKAWRKAGILMVLGEIPAPVVPQVNREQDVHAEPVSEQAAAFPPFPPDEDADQVRAEKADLIEALAAYGIQKDQRSSVETLRGLFDEARLLHG